MALLRQTRAGLPQSGRADLSNAAEAWLAATAWGRAGRCPLHSQTRRRSRRRRLQQAARLKRGGGAAGANQCKWKYRQAEWAMFRLSQAWFFWHLAARSSKHTCWSLNHDIKVAQAAAAAELGCEWEQRLCRLGVHCWL